MLAEAEALTSPDDSVSVYLALSTRALLARPQGDHDAAVPLAREAEEVADRVVPLVERKGGITLAARVRAAARPAARQ